MYRFMMRMRHLIRLMAVFSPLVFCQVGYAEPAEESKTDAEKNAMREALKRLEMPGVKINVDEWSVDVDAVVTLHDGFLELLACIKDTKEHESLISVNAKPSHIHTALLLIGGVPGNPAMRQVVGEGEEARFVDLPPRGGMVDVFLVIDSGEGPKEIPINQFIKKGQDDYHHGTVEEQAEPALELYPTHSFMFTGSVLVERDKEGPRQYVADYSGHVISMVTFGDELLSTPDIHDDANHSLMWAVHSTGLPAVDAAVTLRLKPQRPAPDEKPVEAPAEKSETEQ